MKTKYRFSRNEENLNEFIFGGVGPYDIPAIQPERFEPCDFIDFNQMKSCKRPEETGVHFFIDDYRFRRIWSNLRQYVPSLCRFKAVMSPDFSLYTDYPVAMQIYNHYRKHYVAATLQMHGVKVYPTIAWSDERSFAWCFDGEPEGGTVCVSSVGTQSDDDARRAFLAGYNEMMDRLHPETVIFYGNVPKECRGEIVRIRTFCDKFKEAKINGR